MVALVMTALFVVLWRHGGTDERWRYMSLMLLGAVVLQVTLGISVVVFGVPLPVAVAHNGGAALLILVLILVNHASWSAQQV